MAVKDFIEEALALPVEQRAQIADILLQSLNRTDPQIDAQWAEVAARRWAEIRSGSAKTIPGDKVFSRLRSCTSTDLPPTGSTGLNPKGSDSRQRTLLALFGCHRL